MRYHLRERSGIWHVFFNYKDPKTGVYKGSSRSLHLVSREGKKKINVSEAKLKAEAVVRSLAYLEASVLDYSCPITSDSTVYDAVKYFMDNRPYNREHTREIYLYREKAVLRYFENNPIKVKEFTYNDGKEFVKYMLKFGRTSKKPNSGLSPRTVSDYKQILYYTFDQARLNHIVNNNPMDGVKVPGSKKKTKESSYLFLMQIAVLNGRLCGAKRPGCAATAAGA